MPPKCPELNPVENLWQFLRDNWLSNRVFPSYRAILDHCCHAWNKLVDQPGPSCRSASGTKLMGTNQRDLVLVGAPKARKSMAFASACIAPCSTNSIGWRSARKIYRGIDELQIDLNAWILEYNQHRPHQGRWCFGETPMQTLLAALPLAKEKLMAA